MCVCPPDRGWSGGGPPGADRPPQSWEWIDRPAAGGRVQQLGLRRSAADSAAPAVGSRSRSVVTEAAPRENRVSEVPRRRHSTLGAVQVHQAAPSPAPAPAAVHASSLSVPSGHDRSGRTEWMGRSSAVKIELLNEIGTSLCDCVTLEIVFWTS